MSDIRQQIIDYLTQSKGTSSPSFNAITEPSIKDLLTPDNMLSKAYWQRVQQNMPELAKAYALERAEQDKVSASRAKLVKRNSGITEWYMSNNRLYHNDTHL